MVGPRPFRHPPSTGRDAGCPVARVPANRLDRPGRAGHNRPMRRPSLPALLWIAFAIIVAHNLEEGLTMGAFLETHRGWLPSFLSGMTGARFAISLVIVTLLALLATWAGARSSPNG